MTVSEATVTKALCFCVLILSAKPMPALAGEEWIVAEACGCGGVALLVMGRESGLGWDAHQVTTACQTHRTDAGMSVKEVCAAGTKLGTGLVGIECDMDSLSRMLPAIVFLPEGYSDAPHFVVIVEASKEAVRIVDPPQPDRWFTRESFADLWQGVAIVPRDRIPRKPPWWSRPSLQLFGVACLVMIVSAFFAGRARRPFTGDGSHG